MVVIGCAVLCCCVWLCGATDYYGKFFIVTCTPIFLMLCLLLFYLLPQYVMDSRDMSDSQAGRQRRKRRRRVFWKLTIFSFFLIYPFVSTTVLSMFVCREVNGVSYLKVRPPLPLLCLLLM